MIELLTRNLYKERVNGRIIPVGGMTKNPEDNRDFEFGSLGDWFAYKAKQNELVLDTLSVKEQSPYNNCVFQSYAVTREPDEGKELSVRSLVRYAQSKGYISGNGFSNLRSAQKAGIDFGIAEQSLLDEPKTSWINYAGTQNSPLIVQNALNHRAKSYFKAKGKSEWLKALDDGKMIHTGFTWRSAYNQTGGFKAPWVIRWGAGVAVGGHAVVCKGYNVSKGLFVMQNSFGRDWGDSGDFYVPMDSLQWTEGYVSIDMDTETAIQLIQKYEGTDVKKESSPTIFRIENGKKRPFITSESFFMHGGNFEPASYSVVSGALLDQLEVGEPMP